jgi:Lipocalin-like domain
MNRRTVLVLSATAAMVIGQGVQATAQSARDLVGTWTITSADAYGPMPKGSLIFESNGRFSLILLNSNVPKYASNNRTQGTPSEYKATVEGSLAYFGTYSVNGSELNLHIDGSTFANWNGQDQRRTNLSITGDELRYTQPTPSGGGAPAPLVWKRTK